MLMSILLNEKLALGGISDIVWILLALGTLGAVALAVVECLSGGRGFKRILIQTSKAYVILSGGFPFLAAGLIIFSSLGAGDEFWTREMVREFVTGQFFRGWICYLCVSAVLAGVISAAVYGAFRLLRDDET